MKKLYFFTLSLLGIMSLFMSEVKSLERSSDHTILHTNLIPELISSKDSFQVAATWWLPDYQAGYTKNDNTDSRPADPSGTCAAYGYASSCGAGQTGTVVHPYGELTCYSGCKAACAATVGIGAGEQCSEYCQGNCVKKTCKADVGLDANTETCTERCASNSSVCTKKQCKPSVSYDANTEECSAKCKSNSSICVAKACKPKVSVDMASERCLAYCVSDKSICVSKGCMTSVTVNTGEQCVLYCKSSSSTCVTKSCAAGYVDVPSFWCPVPQTMDCGALGYDKTSGTCGSSQLKLGCPFDSSKFACIGASTCAVGDIYYSDGTCDANVIAGKTPVGVVGYITDGGKGGFVISLYEAVSASWGPQNDLSCIPNYDRDGVPGDINGVQNTQCIMSQTNGSYEAAEFCNSYKPVSSGKGSTGWYLPAAGELSRTALNYNTLNVSLKKINKTVISYTDAYWSSSEQGYSDNKYRAWSVNFNTGLGNYAKNSNILHVRCGLAFGTYGSGADKDETVCKVGFIYYSDGTCDADVVSGKTPVGVVAYLTDGGKHGGAIALEETSVRWSTPNYSNLLCLPNLDVNGATVDMNGKSNTTCIMFETSSGNTYPAASYCNSYKPVSSGKGSSGWYLPAAGELKMISLYYSALNISLQRLSKTQLSSNWYWSSSEGTYPDGLGRDAWIVRPSDGNMGYGYGKLDNDLHVRCVLAF